MIARAFGAYELNAPVKFTQEQIAENIKKEYHKRLETTGQFHDRTILNESGSNLLSSISVSNLLSLFH